MKKPAFHVVKFFSHGRSEEVVIVGTLEQAKAYAEKEDQAYGTRSEITCLKPDQLQHNGLVINLVRDSDFYDAVVSTSAGHMSYVLIGDLEDTERFALAQKICYGAQTQFLKQDHRQTRSDDQFINLIARR